ncbi:MAG TPA: DUF58 domain-containing protein [Jatrophihabitantaceae bacterium]|nr:DUF58 domain-containing protein [Jatrophihabitantaceae bacterium]
MAGSEFGFTTRATCLLAAGATALLCGVLLGQVDLTRAGVLALAVPLLSAVVVHRSRVLIANRRRVEPEHASSGDDVLVHLTITNRSRLGSGALMLEDQLPSSLPGRARFVLDSLASRESRTVTYRLNNLPRGRYRTGPLQVRLTDPFHLIALRRGVTATTDFVVRPVVEALPALSPPLAHDLGDNSGSHSIGTHGADDASTREYRTGDPLRKIHWRSTARMGALMVRQEERPWQGRATVVLDLRESAHVSRLSSGGADDRDERDRSSLEWAISAAASIGSHLLAAGRAVELVSDVDAVRPLASHSTLAFVEHLAGVRGSRNASLAPARSVLASTARESALIAVLGDVDPISLQVLAECHPRGSVTPAVALLIDTGTWAGSPASGPDSRCQNAARALRAAGWRVRVIAHGTGIAEAWRDTLAAAPA